MNHKRKHIRYRQVVKRKKELWILGCTVTNTASAGTSGTRGSPFASWSACHKTKRPFIMIIIHYTVSSMRTVSQYCRSMAVRVSSRGIEPRLPLRLRLRVATFTLRRCDSVEIISNLYVQNCEHSELRTQKWKMQSVEEVEILRLDSLVVMLRWRVNVRI